MTYVRSCNIDSDETAEEGHTLESPFVRSRAHTFIDGAQQMNDTLRSR